VATTLLVRFVLGRYHATPWGRHVNEGQVELPPSPWRLLRALYAVWRTRVPDLDETVVHALLERLGEAPSYFVPTYRLGHSRHYYPDTKHRSGTPSTDRTLDAFAAMSPRAELAVRWPFDLPAEEAKVFERLAESLPYLGRADSLCEARLERDWCPGGGHWLSSPLDVGESVAADVDVVTLLAPTLPLDLQALVARPVDVRGQKLLFPPHTRFVGYERPPEHQMRRRVHRKPWQPVSAARFTITSRVLSPETDVVALADRLRGAAVRKLGDLRGDARARSLLAGRAADGRKLRGHQHAHYLALSDDRRRLAEVAVWAPGGLDEQEMQALSRVTSLWAPEGVPGPGRLEVRLAAYGAASAVLDDLVGPATRWESLTPFVPPRHAKRQWFHFVEQEVRRELRHRALLEPLEVSVTEGDWRSYTRFRPSKRFARAYLHADDGVSVPGPADPRVGPPGAFAQIAFAEPVPGPLSLGYLSHFGLGLFRPSVAMS
jgi:CRISPR-associated protein Csb2